MMAPFCVPAPRIIPLCIPVFGKPRSIDTSTKFELLCETYLKHEIFYTLDGTKPEPYTKIVQGSKTYKYFSPFCLPCGKNTIKAVAVCADIPSMCSNVITKCFDVKTSFSSPSLKSVKKKMSPSSKEKKPIKELEDVEPNIPESIHSFHSGNLSDSSDQNSEIEGNQPCDIFSDLNVEFDTDALEELSKLKVNDADDENNINNAEVCKVQQSLLTNPENVPCTENVNHTLKSDFLSKTDAEISSHEHDVMAKVAALVPDNLICAEPHHCCIKCERIVQFCVSCQKMNAVSSKYCIQCGKQLAQTCSHCKEPNLSVASFCQYCGWKLNLQCSGYNEESSKISQADHAVLAKPQLKHVGLQKIPLMMDKHTQTSQLISEKKKNIAKSPVRKLPPHSPGKGYWHQQLDYICNHIKTYAYNNTEFRRSISEPVLSTLQTIDMIKDENSVAVTIKFSPLSVEEEYRNEA